MMDGRRPWRHTTNIWRQTTPNTNPPLPSPANLVFIPRTSWLIYHCVRILCVTVNHITLPVGPWRFLFHYLITDLPCVKPVFMKKTKIIITFSVFSQTRLDPALGYKVGGKLFLEQWAIQLFAQLIGSSNLESSLSILSSILIFKRHTFPFRRSGFLVENISPAFTIVDSF